MSLMKIVKDGIFDENPTFVQVVGMCPVLAITSSVENGIGMGLAATAVLVGSNLVISLIRKIVPATVRIPIFVVVIASFVTIVQFLLKGYMPALDKSLGLFIPLIVVNCIILARAEAFAFKNSPVAAIADGIGMGLGFTISLIMVSAVREILGAKQIFGIDIPLPYPETLIMIMAPGAFFTLASLMAAINYMRNRNTH